MATEENLVGKNLCHAYQAVNFIIFGYPKKYIRGTESCLICGECGDSTKQLLGCVNPACKSQFCWKCVCEILLDTAVDSSYLECPCCQSPFTQTSLSRLLNGGSTSEDKSNDCKKDYNRFMADNGPEIFSRQILVSVIDDMCNNVTRRCTMDDKSSDISQRSDHVLDDENSGDYISSRRVNEIEMSLGGEQRINRDSASISKILHYIEEFEHKLTVHCPQCGHDTTLLHMSEDDEVQVLHPDEVESPISATSTHRLRFLAYSKEIVRRVETLGTITAERTTESSLLSSRTVSVSPTHARGRAARRNSGIVSSRAPSTTTMRIGEPYVKVCEAIAALLRYEISCDQFVASIESFFVEICIPSQKKKLSNQFSKGLANNIPAYKQLLSLITNPTLRYTTSVAILKRYPNMRLKCCRRLFCYLCGSAEGHRHLCSTLETTGLTPTSPVGQSRPTFSMREALVDGLIQSIIRVTCKTSIHHWDTTRNVHRLAAMMPQIKIPAQEKLVGSSVCEAIFSCSVCMEIGLGVSEYLFKGCFMRRFPTITNCTGCVCKSCALTYITMQVNSTLYTVAPIKCACCGEKLPTAVWQRELRRSGKSMDFARVMDFAKHNEEVDKLCAVYARSGDKARMIRCPGCHSTSSLYSTSNSDDDDGNGVGSRISSITSTAAGLKTTLKSVCADSISEQVILLRAMKAYAYNEITPAQFILGLENFFISKSTRPDALRERIVSGRLHNSVKFRSLIEVISDVERQGAAYNALLMKYPKLLTKCCKSAFCFTCKVGTFHEGKSCEERLREESKIEAQYCPSCAVPTIRTEGCGHILCPCGTSWTWK